MATTKRSGSRRAAQASEIPNQPSTPSRVAQSIADLNRGFDQVQNEVRRLRALGLFRDAGSRQFVKTCRLMLEELRYWATTDLAMDILDCAEQQWGRWGILRYRYEEKFRDRPNAHKHAEC
jgi:hypothetical protein